MISKNAHVSLWNFPFSLGRKCFWNAILVRYNLQYNFFTFLTCYVSYSVPVHPFWKTIPIRIYSEPTISKKLVQHSVPVLCIFKHFRLYSVFRTLFWIFIRTHISSVPVLLGTVQIRKKYGSVPAVRGML